MNELVQVKSAKASTDKVQLFNNKEFGDVRVIVIDGEAWFVGKDVATTLGYAIPNKALVELVDDVDRKVLNFKAYSKTEQANKFKWLRDALWTNPNDFSDKWIINESGLFSLIMSSHLPTAKQFKHWVTSEVLPAIHKNGGYIAPTARITPEFLEQMAQQMREAQQRIEYLEIDNDDLREQIGDSTYYKQVKALPWLLDYFVKSDAMYKAAGKHLSWMSRKMGKEIKDIESTQYDHVHAYRIEVINAFHDAVENDKTVMQKYRKDIVE